MGLPRYKLRDREEEFNHQRDGEGEREKKRDRDRQKETERERERQRQRKRQRQRERERERERERGTVCLKKDNRPIIINKPSLICPAMVVHFKMMCLHHLWVTVCQYMLSIFFHTHTTSTEFPVCCMGVRACGANQPNVYDRHRLKAYKPCCF